MTDKQRSYNNRQQGNVLFMILIAVVLLAALSFVIARPGGDSGSGMSANRIAEEIKSQAQVIRAAIMECVLVYDNGYPEQPLSSLMSNLQCDVNTDSVTPHVPNLQYFFTGSANRALPKPPNPFTDGWHYDVNPATHPATIAISLSKAMNCAADQAMKSAFEILGTQYTTDEAVTVCNGTTASFTLFIVKGT